MMMIVVIIESRLQCSCNDEGDSDEFHDGCIKRIISVSLYYF